MVKSRSKSRSSSKSRSRSKSKTTLSSGVNIPTNTKQVKSFMSNLVRSRCILYSLFVLAVMNIVVYLQMNNIPQIILFLAIGGLTYFFTKNIVVVLGTAILLSNLLNVHYFNNRLSTSWNVREGFKEGALGKKNKSKKDDDSEEKESKEVDSDSDDEDEECEPDDEECQKKNGFKGRLRPASVTGKDKDLNNSYIDKSQTIENAYSSLDNMLGEKGMKGLSDETNRLISKQNQLMDSIKTMGPMMNNMNGLLQSLGKFNKNTDMSAASKDLSSALDTFNKKTEGEKK